MEEERVIDLCEDSCAAAEVVRNVEGDCDIRCAVETAKMMWSPQGEHHGCPDNSESIQQC